MKLKVILEKSDQGGYTVFVPSLPGCVSEGDTREQAIANIKEAIELYLEPAPTILTSHHEAKSSNLQYEQGPSSQL